MNNGVAPRLPVNKENWKQIIPVPDDVVYPSKDDYPEKDDKGNPTGIMCKHTHEHIYPMETEETWGIVHRFERYRGEEPVLKKNGKRDKVIVPKVYVDDGNRCRWLFGKLLPFPLYRLDLISKHKDIPVVMFEGEVKADEANIRFEEKKYEYVATSWQGGAGIIKNMEVPIITELLKPLKGHRVICWADNDDHSIGAMTRIASFLDDVILLRRPKQKKYGWDIVDAIKKDNWDYDAILNYIERDFITPWGWKVSKWQGIQGVAKDGSYKSACGSPAYISKRLINVVNSTERLEVQYYEHAKKTWRTIVDDRATFSNSKSVVKLSNESFPVSSNRAGMFVGYVDAFMDENDVPICEATDKMGWVINEGSQMIDPGKNKYFPYSADLEWASKRETSRDLYKAIHQSQGTLEEWKNKIDDCLQHNSDGSLRWILGATFASPLLAIIDERSFILHFHYKTTAGKTAAFKASASAFGLPCLEKGVIDNFSSTRTHMEYMCSELNNFPYFVNECQLLKENKSITANDFAYMFGENAGKGRANNLGGRQGSTGWHCITITNGEEALLEDTAQQGTLTRTMEIYAKPFDTKGKAKEAHKFFKHHYGTAFPVYISRLKERDTIADHKHIFDRLIAETGDHPHLEYIAVVCLGDFYRNIYVWDTDVVEAFESCIEMGVKMLANVTMNQIEDTWVRAQNCLKGWIFEKQTMFDNPSVGNTYGWKKGNIYYIPNKIVTDVLTDRQYVNIKQIYRDWAANGVVIPEGKDKSEAFKLKSHNGVKHYVCAFIMPEGKDDDEADDQPPKPEPAREKTDAEIIADIPF